MKDERQVKNKPLRSATTAEERSAAARLMGSITTEKKAAASRLNGLKSPGGPGRSPVPLYGIPCVCGAGEVVEGHKASCPRGAAVIRRSKAGKDAITGESLSAEAGA